jgi:hypothetical protein
VSILTVGQPVPMLPMLPMLRIEALGPRLRSQPFLSTLRGGV